MAPILAGRGSPFKEARSSRTKDDRSLGATGSEFNDGDNSDGDDGDELSSDEEALGGGKKGKDDSAENDDTCPVCLDEPPHLLLLNCKHRLCLGCARDLTQRHNLTPALCPYCRTVIAGFQLSVLRRE